MPPTSSRKPQTKKQYGTARHLGVATHMPLITGANLSVADISVGAPSARQSHIRPLKRDRLQVAARRHQCSGKAVMAQTRCFAASPAAVAGRCRGSDREVRPCSACSINIFGERKLRDCGASRSAAKSFARARLDERFGKMPRRKVRLARWGLR